MFASAERCSELVQRRGVCGCGGGIRITGGTGFHSECYSSNCWRQIYRSASSSPSVPHSSRWVVMLSPVCRSPTTVPNATCDRSGSRAPPPPAPPSRRCKSRVSSAKGAEVQTAQRRRSAQRESGSMVLPLNPTSAWDALACDHSTPPPPSLAVVCLFICCWLHPIRHFLPSPTASSPPSRSHLSSLNYSGPLPENPTSGRCGAPSVKPILLHLHHVREKALGPLWPTCSSVSAGTRVNQTSFLTLHK